jgi:hypothetical protein
VTSQTQRISQKKKQDSEKPTWRRVGHVLLGLALAAVGFIMLLVSGVQAVEGTGLVGVRGTFTVDFCERGDSKTVNHECSGDFVAHGDSPDEKVSGRLDNGEDYASSTAVDAVGDIVRGGDHYRETGAGEMAMSLAAGLGPSLLCLALGIHWTRRWARALRT